MSSVCNASYVHYNLSCDNYILMYIPTLNYVNASISNQLLTFKISVQECVCTWRVSMTLFNFFYLYVRTGVCTCMEGFVGSGCQSLDCSNKCSNAGRCYDMQDRAIRTRLIT